MSPTLGHSGSNRAHPDWLQGITSVYQDKPTGDEITGLLGSSPAKAHSLRREEAAAVQVCRALCRAFLATST